MLAQAIDDGRLKEGIRIDFYRLDDELKTD